MEGDQRSLKLRCKGAGEQEEMFTEGGANSQRGEGGTEDQPKEGEEGEGPGFKRSRKGTYFVK